MAIGAGLMVGGWFASVAISKVFEKLVTYISDQYEYRGDATPKLEKLKINLRTLKDTIDGADGAPMEDRRLQLWLVKLREAVYDAEDVLDKFEYKVLEAQNQNQNQVRRNLASVSCDVLKQTNTAVKRLIFADKDINELLSIADRFEAIVSKMEDFLALLEPHSDLPTHPEFRQTSSFLTAHQVLGRDEEIARLLEELGVGTHDHKSKPKPKPKPRSENFTVVPIVGMGGLGKTTLAQYVYNDKRIMKRFDLRVWVCVSHTFDLMRITKEIIQLASIRTPDDFHSIQSLERIQKILSEGLKGKRFLIVLDDVWDLTPGQWVKLCGPFRCGRKGSRFLLTARLAGMVHKLNTIKPVFVDKMEKGAYSVFFKQCAFGNADPQRYPHLDSIGSEIAETLMGSPLAAKTVGAVLSSNLDESHWNNILEKGLCELKQDGDGILPALRLTYEHLPAHLKQCVEFCALFPTKHVFERDTLVRMWITQGFVRPIRNKNVEDTGRDYFDELLAISFFQCAEQENNNQYVIHSLLHEVARSVSSDEYCVIDNNKDIVIPKRLHHLCVVGNSLPQFCKNQSKMRCLRSLVLLADDGCLNTADHQEMFSKLKRLRLLIISSYKGELPKNIGRLIHLRYLQLSPSQTETAWIPDSLSKLFLLQGLNLQGCSICTLPKGINKLINLQYLIASPEAVSSIEWIGRLTSLRELPEYRVKGSKGHEIGQLGEMKELRGRLHIRCLEDVPGEKEATGAMLSGKAHLNGLRLEWGDLKGVSSPDCKPGYEGVLEGLKPHSDILGLEIAGYGGKRSPNWLMDRWLSKLTDIRLDKCGYWKDLPPLGQLPRLRVLHLRGLRGVKKIDGRFYGGSKVDVAFPSLEELSFSDMGEWKEWSKVEGRTLFPHLSKLSVTGCPNLEGPLPLHSPLLGIIIQSTAFVSGNNEQVEGSDDYSSTTLQLCILNTSQLAGWLPPMSLSSLRKMEIRGFSKHIPFAEEAELFKYLTSLQQLTFDRCDKLQSLPPQLKHLQSLKTLRITGCPQIQSMPDLGSPTSLEELFIHGCHQELAQQCGNKDGPDWHKIADIPRVTIHDCHCNVIYECSPFPTSQPSLNRDNVAVLPLLLFGILLFFPGFINSLRIAWALIKGVTLKRSL